MADPTPEDARRWRRRIPSSVDDATTGPLRPAKYREIDRVEQAGWMVLLDYINEIRLDSDTPVMDREMMNTRMRRLAHRFYTDLS